MQNAHAWGLTWFERRGAGDDMLWVAGAPDVLDPKDPFAAFEGRKGARLVSVSAEDGASGALRIVMPDFKKQNAFKKSLVPCASFVHRTRPRSGSAVVRSPYGLTAA